MDLLQKLLVLLALSIRFVVAEKLFIPNERQFIPYTLRVTATEKLLQWDSIHHRHVIQWRNDFRSEMRTIITILKNGFNNPFWPGRSVETRPLKDSSDLANLDKVKTGQAAGEALISLIENKVKENNLTLASFSVDMYDFEAVVLDTQLGIEESVQKLPVESQSKIFAAFDNMYPREKSGRYPITHPIQQIILALFRIEYPTTYSGRTRESRSIREYNK